MHQAFYRLDQLQYLKVFERCVDLFRWKWTPFQSQSNQHHAWCWKEFHALYTKKHHPTPICAILANSDITWNIMQGFFAFIQPSFWDFQTWKPKIKQSEILNEFVIMLGQTFYIQVKKWQFFVMVPGSGKFCNKGIFHIVFTFCISNVTVLR